MLRLVPGLPDGLRLLCLGAHPDDIEIGAGGTILRLVGEGRVRSATWVAFSGSPERRREGTESAGAFLAGVGDRTVAFHDLRDGYFPAQFAELKDAIESVKASARPDLVLAPRTDDAHQDHRLVAELARTVFRDHLILEYEIPKYDGDLRPPIAYVALDEAVLARKVDLILETFGSQHGRTWLDGETFRGLARIRGIEAGGGAKYAEAFHLTKVQLDMTVPGEQVGGQRAAGFESEPTGR